MTLCDICHVNPARLKLTQIVNDQKTELNLCKQCAEEKGLGNPFGSVPSLFGAVLIGLLSQQIPDRTRTVSSVKCQRCGTSKADFEQTGLLGCGACYEAFEDDLKFILRRIHGSNKHIGYRPASMRKTEALPDLKSLRRRLRLAVKKENFEEAARLRDLVRDAEAQSRFKNEQSKNADKKRK